MGLNSFPRLVLDDKESLDWSKMATVHIGMGSSSKEWLIPAAILSKRSVFFKNALKERWKEGQDRLVTLADDDPDIFSLNFTYSTANRYL